MLLKSEGDGGPICLRSPLDPAVLPSHIKAVVPVLAVVLVDARVPFEAAAALRRASAPRVDGQRKARPGPTKHALPTARTVRLEARLNPPWRGNEHRPEHVLRAREAFQIVRSLLGV